MLIGPHRQIKNFKLFPFTGDMDKGKFVYGGFSDKITTWTVAFVPTKGILSKDDLKRKIIQLSFALI